MNRTALSGDQTIELHDWMRENRDRILKDAMNAVDVANRAQGDLGFSIASASVRGRANLLKIRFDKNKGAIDLDPPEPQDMGGVIVRLDTLNERIANLEAMLRSIMQATGAPR